MSEAELPNNERPECASNVLDRFPADHQLRCRVRDYLRQCKSPCKSWFTAKGIADSLDASPRAVGLCLTAIEIDPQSDVRICRVRERSSFNRYQVEIQ